MNIKLFEYASSGNLDGIKEFYSKSGVAILKEKDESENTVTMVASYWGHLSIVEFSIEVGADINEKNKNGLTPIGFACKSGMYKVVKLLVDSGADLNVLSPDGETLLMIACMFADVRTVQILLDCGVDPSFQDDSGYSAVMYAAFNSNHLEGLEILKLLQKHGVNLYVKNNDGASLIDFSREKHNDLIQKYLLSNPKST